MKRSILPTALLFASLLFLSACDAEEPLVDTEKLIGIWEKEWSATASLEWTPSIDSTAIQDWLFNIDWEQQKKLSEGSYRLFMQFPGDGTIRYYDTFKENGKLYSFGTVVQYSLGKDGFLILSEPNDEDYYRVTKILQLNDTSLIMVGASKNSIQKSIRASCGWYRRINSLPAFQTY